ncbi:hypothetical protein FHX42_003100 [Saccharopolyspora lacisalsi]|uniref:Uncharacterized protein n=1 Tax=Halosaccharopolyspora lacisalsi TaxID=1000566 RepID=A0A839DW53_9PSEU|nr:hypothetical protein [Halosaccharopolyspora lacisalsi]
MAPHPVQVQVRMCSGIAAVSLPQAGQVLLAGNQRSTTMTSRPYQWALYSSMLRNCDHEASEIARARWWLASMVRTERS